jgi:hypothetical protein
MSCYDARRGSEEREKGRSPEVVNKLEYPIIIKLNYQADDANNQTQNTVEHPAEQLNPSNVEAIPMKSGESSH